MTPHSFLTFCKQCMFGWLVVASLVISSAMAATNSDHITNNRANDRLVRGSNGSRIELVPLTVQCLLRPTATLNESAINAGPKNFYECPGSMPFDYVQCCDNNRCCLVGTYRPMFLVWPTNVTELVLCLIGAIGIIVAGTYVCCCCSLCPFYRCWIGDKFDTDYAGCAHKISESTLLEKMLTNESENLTEESNIDADICLPDFGELHDPRNLLPPLSRVALAADASVPHFNGGVVAMGNIIANPMLESINAPMTSGDHVILGGNTHFVTLRSTNHSTMSRVNSLDAGSTVDVVTSTGVMSVVLPRSSTSVTFAKPPMKSILKMNSLGPTTTAITEPHKFSYRHPSSSSTTSTDTCSQSSSHRSTRSTSLLFREDVV